MEQVLLAGFAGSSVLLNIGLLVVVVCVIRQNRAISFEAMGKSQDAMDAILAASNLPAADFRGQMRERSEKKFDAQPVERERTVLS